MKKVVSPQLEASRIRIGNYRTTNSDGLMGAFRIKGPKNVTLVILSSGTDYEYGWEHVSVSLPHRTPRWEEMCFVKDLFWEDEEWVLQYHPPRSEYVNCHPNCLHLWRSINTVPQVPPSHLVGPKDEKR